MVVDSVGNVVGRVVGLMFDGTQRVLPNVVLQQQGLMVGLMVTPNGFEGSGGSLAFSLADCKGQAFPALPLVNLDTLYTPPFSVR